MSLWKTIVDDLKAVLAKIEDELKSALNFLISYVKEAVSEEEATLFPLIEAQATQILVDVVKTQGLTVKERIALAETEIMVALAADGKVAAATLISAYVTITAHKLGLVDGNQGNMAGGSSTGV